MYGLAATSPTNFSMQGLSKYLSKNLKIDCSIMKALNYISYGAKLNYHVEITGGAVP